MSIRKDGNHWKVDIRPEGHTGKRVIRRFKTKAEAIRFEAHVIAKSVEAKPWNPKSLDNRRLSELIEIWQVEHAPTITSGPKVLQLLDAFCEELRNPIAREISTKDVSRWRSVRLETAKVTTTNKDLRTLRSFFNWLIKRKHIDYQNPIDGVDTIRTHEQERPFLSADQIQALMDYLPHHPHRDAAILIQVCLATGARWSEAQNLTRDRIFPNRLIFTKTKSRATRAVPITRELYDVIYSNGGPPFRNCQLSARRLLRDRLDLPEGISTHVLRHTFASHFIMAGGNILTLQRILGHSSIQMTMRYAHLAPDHLEEAVHLNPIELGKKRESEKLKTIKFPIKSGV